MEHSEAISTKAAERYLLGELNDTDADAFEEHFFDCPLCADDVRDEAKLIEAGRAVAREKKANVVSIDERRRSRRGWLQVAAAAILVIGIGGPLMFTRTASQPKPTVITQVSLTAERGAQNAYTVAKGQALVLYVGDIETGQYRWKIADVSGTSVAGGTASRKDTENGLNLWWPGELPAGNYTLVIDGVRESDGKPVSTTSQFTIRR